MGILLTILALVSCIIFFPLGILYSIFRYSTWTSVDSHWFRIAIALDELANVVMKHPLNDFCIIDGGFEFGNTGETMSSIFGKNKKSNTLTKFGRCIANSLDKIQRNHVEKAIEPTQIDQIK